MIHKFYFKFSNNTQIRYDIDTDAINPWIESNIETDNKLFSIGGILEDDKLLIEWSCFIVNSLHPEMFKICSPEQIIEMFNSLTKQNTYGFTED